MYLKFSVFYVNSPYLLPNFLSINSDVEGANIIVTKTDFCIQNISSIKVANPETILLRLFSSGEADSARYSSPIILHENNSYPLVYFLLVKPPNQVASSFHYHAINNKFVTIQ